MAVFNGAFPILPGKEQEGRNFAAACMGEGRKGFEEQLSSSKIARETWGPSGNSDGELQPGVV